MKLRRTKKLCHFWATVYSYSIVLTVDRTAVGIEFRTAGVDQKCVQQRASGNCMTDDEIVDGNRRIMSLYIIKRTMQVLGDRADISHCVM